MADRKLTYAVEQRLRLIDFLLARYGRVNRGALMDYFGISMPQASLDLQHYQERTGSGQIRYDATTRAYVCDAGFKRCWP
ncbi:hypothetical protein D5301_12845 [Stenotrophomonas sp. MH181796]|uniref:hypothetical protein n=1 Tax=Stenotrophomonas sp. MH181796 TaxID=2339228 RepID=UPI00129D1367|nr:hypothetical protein [Stenotrophomonas sp. MH181796]MRI43121.1 hypothetical protein [Stenotrophomonas sp. MH181796]